MKRLKRPAVIEAWMTHSRTPFITERLKSGRIRKVARRQQLYQSWAVNEAGLKDIYGKRWKGIRGLD